MTTISQEPFQPGVQYIEKLNPNALLEWLEAELKEKIHLLAGQADDQPNQAITNHFAHLSTEVQDRFRLALEQIVAEWIDRPEEWSESSSRNLMQLCASLKATAVKRRLKSLSLSPAFSKIWPLCGSAILRTIAALSSNEDRQYWLQFPKRNPATAGMAFQCLTRIAPMDALAFLRHLPPLVEAVSSVARALPQFLSIFDPEHQMQALKTISEAIDQLPDELSQLIILALRDGGFPIDTVRPPEERNQIMNWKIGIARFLGHVNINADLKEAC